MPHEGEVVAASLLSLGRTPKGQTRNILIHSQGPNFITAFFGVQIT
jgi:hypothetical protein